jgi:enoyl-CoA hydratase/carnithine racemase
MPRLIGHMRAAEALLLGEPFSAESALEWGLVNRIVPPSQAHALAQQQALRLASKPMSSLIETKRLMKLGTQSEVAQRMDQESVIFGRMLGEPAAREAFTAFMDKRLPDFSKH